LRKWSGHSKCLMEQSSSYPQRKAYEAATGLLDYLFHDSGARRIYGFVEDDNLRSKRLCERLGMRHEGCMKEFISFVCHPDGAPRYEDTCIYAILNKEWKSNRQR
jgi:ribosomal-protein-alanine N-acetyltransferase